MTDKTFTELLRSANEVLAHAQGKTDLYVTTLPVPAGIGEPRCRHTPAAGAPCSQAAFAGQLNIGNLGYQLA